MKTEIKEPKELTINQLLDGISDIKIDNITPALASTRQRLIDFKKSVPNGGLLKISNSQHIITMINECKAVQEAKEKEKENQKV